MKKLLFIAKINILANIFLATIKGFAGLAFGSISLVSDAINSIGDVLTAIIIHFTIKINNEEPDHNHPFGHTRAESIAGYTIGILMIILAITITKYSLEKLITKSYGTYSILLPYVIGISLAIKLFLYIYTKLSIKGKNTPALSAIASDHLNDILILLGVFIGVLGMKLGYPEIDALIGLLISAIILKTGIVISYENIKQLMGQSAPKEIENKIRKKAEEIPGTLKINKIKTQYLGNQIQTEIEVFFSSKTSIKKAHNIGNKIRDNVESLDEIIDCFVHIDSE